MNLKKIFIAFILMLFLSACVPNQEVTNNQNLRSRVLGNNILGLASFKEFDLSNSNQQKKTLGLVTNKINVENKLNDQIEGYIKVTYPFDYVKIHKATMLDLYIPEDSEDEELEDLKLSSGLGSIEVTIAEFTTYIIDKEDLDKDGDVNELLPDVTDTLISFRGSIGFYTILSNSYAYGNDHNFESGHKYWVFSSHKSITSTDIEKDFEPPIYCVRLEISVDDDYSISFKKDSFISSVWDFYNDKKLTKYNIDSSTIRKVSRDTLYNVYELANLPEAEQIVQIISIDVEGKYIEVKSDNVLSTVYIDGNTEYNNEGVMLSELWNHLIVGNYIKVTYDYYFEGYIPIRVYGNSIIKIDVQE